MFGCASQLGVYQFGHEFGEMALKDAHSNCNHSYGMGWVSVAYFISFAIMGSQVRAGFLFQTQVLSL
jgi:hypothetical protein